MSLPARWYETPLTEKRDLVAWYCHDQLINLGWNLEVEAGDMNGQTIEMEKDGHFVYCHTKAFNTNPTKYRTEVFIIY